MTDDKLARLKRNIDLAKRDRPRAEPPELPKTEMFNRPLTPEESKAPNWQENLAKHRGAGYLHAEMTMQLPTPLALGFPMHLRNDLYEWAWENHKTGKHKETVGPLVSKLSTRELTSMLDACESFKSEDLTSIGAVMYKALLDEEERRSSESKGATQVRVAEHGSFRDNMQLHEEHEEHEQLEEAKMKKRLGQ